MSEDRADSFLRLIRHAQCGRLKVYLGYAAGVGKTYQMLLEGHRLKDEGIDVVIGYLETHGRADIVRLSRGLEMVPRKRQDYRGVVVEEMDVDAVIARKPQVALIDELAHTNAPGSRNPKRYQDVQDVLARGIHVITTMNVQHLESLYDTVERSVGVKVRERLPDSVLAGADQIVDVDVSTEDLRARLEEGKIYPRERVPAALANFFRAGNLERLRELTLRELASQIDLRSRDLREEERVAAPDQVMVALSSHGPNSERLLRYASRLAGRLNRNWYAVYVQTRAEEATAIDATTQRLLADTLTLAKQLGAMVFTYKGEDIADTILRFAREYRVGHIVVGSSTPKPAWKRFGRNRNVVRDLIRKARDVTVIVLDTRAPEAEAPAAPVETVPVRPVAPPAAAPSTLSETLAPDRVVIWDAPAGKETVLRTLALAAGRNAAMDDPEGLVARILAREAQGSTFFNEGAAFPHARVNGLTVPIAALGLTRDGVSDVATEKPIQAVFLLISPEQSPDIQVRLLALASRAARDRILVRDLLAAASPEDALDTLRRWEGVSPAETADPRPPDRRAGDVDPHPRPQ